MIPGTATLCIREAAHDLGYTTCRRGLGDDRTDYGGRDYCRGRDSRSNCNRVVAAAATVVASSVVVVMDVDIVIDVDIAIDIDVGVRVPVYVVVPVDTAVCAAAHVPASATSLR